MAGPDTGRVFNMRVLVEYETDDAALCDEGQDQPTCARELAESITRNAPLGWEILNYQIFAS